MRLSVVRIRTSIVQFDLVTKIERKIFTSSSQVLQLIKNIYCSDMNISFWLQKSALFEDYFSTVVLSTMTGGEIFMTIMESQDGPK